MMPPAKLKSLATKAIKVNYELSKHRGNPEGGELECLQKCVDMYIRAFGNKRSKNLLLPIRDICSRAARLYSVLGTGGYMEAYPVDQNSNGRVEWESKFVGVKKSPEQVNVLAVARANWMIQCESKFKYFKDDSILAYDHRRDEVKAKQIDLDVLFLGRDIHQVPISVDALELSELEANALVSQNPIRGWKIIGEHHRDHYAATEFQNVAEAAAHINLEMRAAGAMRAAIKEHFPPEIVDLANAYAVRGTNSAGAN